MNYHITITFFNKVGKIRRNANQNTSITQRQKSPANTEVPHHIAPLEVMSSIADASLVQENKICSYAQFLKDWRHLVCPPCAPVHQHYCNCHRLIPSQLVPTKHWVPAKHVCVVFQIKLYFTTDSSVTYLSGPPEGRLALGKQASPHNQPCK